MSVESESEGKSYFRFFLPFFYNSKKKQTLNVFSLFFAFAPIPFDLADLKVQIGEHLITPQFSTFSRSKPARRHVCFFKLSVPLSCTHDLTIHNPVTARVFIAGEQVINQDICYNVLLPKAVAARGPLYIVEPTQTTVYFRQAAGLGTVLTVRHLNETDYHRNKMKLAPAWLVARLLPFKRPVLFYEKNSHKYEESARLVYEELIRGGEKNAYFIVNRNTPGIEDVAEEYRRHFIYQHSFKHYLYFFRCRVFIGTEAISHALELRTHSILFLLKLRSKKNTFIFLQHGVMYMLSVNSPERTAFQRPHIRSKVRVVVSSKKEAQHFIDLGGFASDEMIISGLPSFDGSYQNQSADRILIMPTWRIWEFNSIKNDPDNSKYVAMIRRMVNAVPEELKKKVLVMPHPLFNRLTFNNVEQGDAQKSFDELLRDVRLLITDYSSISFDAFYRGSNVLFYWEELYECIAHYGEPTQLMLNEQNAFGEVCYTPEELREAISKAYSPEQDTEFKHRYSDLVEYHDGKNTQRLIKALYDQGIL
jgi:hypothetical protein